MSDPKVVITITASDGFGTVEARSEFPAFGTPEALRERVAKEASETASRAADLIDAHIATLKART